MASMELIKRLEAKRDELDKLYEENQQRLTALDICVEACVRLGRQEMLARWIEDLTDLIKVLDAQSKSET